MEESILAKRLARAQAEIQGLEQLIETKARDIFLSKEKLRRTTLFMEKVLRAMGSPMVLLNPEGLIVQSNHAAHSMLGCTAEDLQGIEIGAIANLPEAPAGGRAVPLLDHAEVEMHLTDDSNAATLLSISEILDEAEQEIEGYVCVWADLRAKQKSEMELRHSQKLESLGQMAAGVAHEINTPIQFVGDSLCFLRESFDDLVRLVMTNRERRAKWSGDPLLAGHAQAADKLEEEMDVDFIVEEAPGAFERATNGLGRVAKIVKALKSFSHPGSEDKAPANINALLETTLTLSHNEYKYVANLETEYGEIPEVPCHAGDLGQVILNLVVNAAHAIADKVKGTGQLGTISVRTRLEGDFVLIEVEDSGTGIPNHVIDRIFDPFFTTKEVGRGTGQGLSISRRIVVDKHHGRLEVVSYPGDGSIFRMYLPVYHQAVAA